MAWRVEFATTALRELDKLDRQVARRILAFEHNRVVVNGDPRGVGQALKGSESFPVAEAGSPGPAR